MMARRVLVDKGGRISEGKRSAPHPFSSAPATFLNPEQKLKQTELEFGLKNETKIR